MDHIRISSQHIFLLVVSGSGHVAILFSPGSFRDAVPIATNAPASWIAGVVKHQGIQPWQNSAATGQVVGSFMEQRGGCETPNTTEVRRAVSLEGREVVTRSGHNQRAGFWLCCFLIWMWHSNFHFVKFIKLFSYDTCAFTCMYTNTHLHTHWDIF